jgi:preprotein translocase subunit SecY
MLDGNRFLEALGMFSGGGFSNMSILLVGVMPYITASIIFNLATYAVPKLKEMQQEGGDIGRRKIANYSRLLSVPLAALQSFGMLKLLQNTNVIDSGITNFQFFNLIMIITAGSVLLM